MRISLGRRWLSLFLTFVLCLSLVPAVFAVDEAGGYKIAIAAGAREVEEGKSISLSATVTNGGVEDNTILVRWSTTDIDLIEIESTTGQVTGKKAGTATVTASCKVPTGTTSDGGATRDGTTTEISTTCQVTVKAAQTQSPVISISQEELTLEVGKRERLTLKQDGRDITSGVSWKSDSPSVATVDSIGQVEAKSEGRAIVTATYNNVDYTCTVTVPEPQASVTINRNTPLVTNKGLTVQLTATSYPAGQVIEWESADPDVASVDYRGLVTARKPGKTTITAYVANGPKSDPLDVTVAGLIAKEDPMTVEENKELSLRDAVECFGDVIASSVTYTSQNTYVAEINGTTLTGLRTGEATIEARANNGTYRTTFTVKVVADSSTRIPQTGTISMTTGETLPFTDLTGYFNSQLGGKVTYVTGLLVSTKEGTLYYNYNSEAEPGWGVAQVDNYYLNPGPGQRGLKDVTFVPKPNFTGGQVTISYTAFTSDNKAYSCSIELTVTSNGSTADSIGAITLNTKYNTAVKFDANEFGAVCRERMGVNLDYVTFSLPSERQGTLYTNYKGEGDYGTKVTLNTHYSGRNLDDVWFVPAPGYSSEVSGPVTIYYTGFPKGDSGKSYTGQVVITVGNDSASSIGGPTYDAPQGGAVTLDDADFDRFCREFLDTNQTLNYIRFNALPSSSEGTLYYDYRSSGSRGTLVNTGTTYYTGTYTPRIDRITFLCAEDFSGTVRIPFTGWTNNGTQFAGNLEINVRGGNGSGDIQYVCPPGRSVSFNTGDFTTLCRNLTNRTLNYIRFQSLPSSADGVLYYGNSSRVSTTTSYYNGSSPRISSLSFRASNSFSGSIDIPFVGYASGDGGTFNGVITISSSGTSTSRGDITYSIENNQTAVFDRDDFDDVSLWETDYKVSTVRFDLPSTSQGELYRNYRSSTSKGTRISSSTTSIPASELDRVAFIPTSGYIGTVYVNFTARSTSGEEFSGTVEIQVERPAPDVTVRYSTRSAPVTFRGSDFARSGYTLSSIRFGSLPSSGDGHLYYRYTSPTRYDRQASTASNYNLTGSNLISDLTFVPKAGFSGTVTLPYTGTNSNGSTFEGEVVITVSPSYSVANFNDLGSYSSQQRAAVEYLYSNGITSGVSATQYGPEQPITRGDFALMVYKAFGLTPAGSGNYFNDVPSTAYYAQAVNTLYAQGIVSGIGGGSYGPRSQVTRQDALIMVRQAMRSVGWSANDGYTSTLNGYTDGSSVAGYAQGAVSYALQMGYLPTNGGRIAPRDNLTRIDMAEIIHRVLTY